MKTAFFYQKEYYVASMWPILLLALVVFPILIITSVKKISFKDTVDEKNILSLDDSLVLRGIAILIVMIHHYSQGLADHSKLVLYYSVGYISVAVFLLLSGYSSYIQLKKNGDKFWDKYLFKRLLRLLVPFWVINLIHSLFYLPSPWQFISATLTFKRIIGDVTEWPTVWFVVTIVFFTVLFWICFRFTKNPQLGLLLFSIGTFSSIVIRVLLKHQSYWYNTSIAFLTGIVYAMYKDFIRNYLIRFRITILIIFSTVWGAVIFVSIHGYNPGWLQIICSEAFVIIVLTMEQCTIMRSTILKKIGTASWEIFLIHQLVYSAYYSVCKDFYGLSGVLCILISIVSGILICNLDKKLVNLIDKLVYRIQDIIGKKEMLNHN